MKPEFYIFKKETHQHPRRLVFSYHSKNMSIWFKHGIHPDCFDPSQTNIIWNTQNLQQINCLNNRKKKATYRSLAVQWIKSLLNQNIKIPFQSFDIFQRRVKQSNFKYRPLQRTWHSYLSGQILRARLIGWNADVRQSDRAARSGKSRSVLSIGALWVTISSLWRHECQVPGNSWYSLNT